MDAEDAHADAARETGQRGAAQGQRDGQHRVDAGGRLRGHHEGRHGGHDAHREVDAAGDHRQRLGGSEDRQRHGELDGVGDPTVIDSEEPIGIEHDARLQDLQGGHQQEQQEEQRDDRVVAHQAAGPEQAPMAHPSRSSAAQSSSCPSSPQGHHRTDEHDRDHDEALDDLGHVGVDREQRQVLAREAQDEDGDDGPHQAASAAGQADAPEDDGGDAGQRYGPWMGVPMPVPIVSTNPPIAAKRPASAYEPDLGPVHRHAAAEGRQPVGADGVEGEPEARSTQRDPDDAEGADEQEQRLGQEGGEVSGQERDADACR